MSGSVVRCRSPQACGGSRSESGICEDGTCSACCRRFSSTPVTSPGITLGLDKEALPDPSSVINTHPGDNLVSSPKSSLSQVTSTFVGLSAQEFDHIKASSTNLSATQSTPPPKTPPNKLRHRRSPSSGLLSPISSFASFKAAFGNSSRPNSPRVPSRLSFSPSPTPRSPAFSTTSRGAPSLLRISQPLHSSIPTTAITSATATAQEFHPLDFPVSLLFSTQDNNTFNTPTMSYIHQPRAQHPPSPSTSGSSNSAQRPVTPSYRPPSRSEKLLRDALMRDEQERNPMPTSPLLSQGPSSGRAGHRRRHSHVPTSTTSAARSRQREEEQEELARGNFLFRTPMLPNNARPPSPFSAASETQPSLARRHSSRSHGQPHYNNAHGHHHQHQYGRHEEPSPYSYGFDATASPIDYASASHSPSRGQRSAESPLARRSSVKSQYNPGRPASPSPASHSRAPTHYSPSHPTSPQHSPSLSRSKVPRSLAPGSPAADSHYNQHPGEPLTMTPHEQVLRARLERVLSSGRVVNRKEEERELRQEWIERELGKASVYDDDGQDSDENVVRDENGRRAWRVRPMVNTPPSSGTNSARSMSKEEMNAAIQRPRTPASASHHRSRSHTDPAPPMPYNQYSAQPSPRRSTTAPSATALTGSKGRHYGRSGTTPPLVSDNAGTPEEEDPEDVRLLTPPPTPPSYPRAFAHPTKEYAPSPYKSSFDLKRRGVVPPPLHLLRNDEYSSEEEEEGSSGSCSCSECSGLQTKRHLYHGLSPPAHPTMHSRRPQFNVRRASAQCRQMEGYVPFAAVEGLGVPPDADSDDNENKKGDARKNGESTGGVGDWMRWTKRRLLGGDPGHVV